VNMELRTVSVFVIDTWAESVYTSVTELIERSGEQSSKMKDASISAWQDGMTQDVLKARISDLQAKLFDAENRERKMNVKLGLVNDGATKATKDAKEGETAAKKRIRNLEMLLAEQERKVRQKDNELIKLTEKLRLAAVKERDANSRRSDALKSRTPGSPGGAPGVIDALEHENASLKNDVNDLTKQISKLTGALRKAENATISVGAMKSTSISSSRIPDSDDESGHGSTPSQIKDEQSILTENLDRSTDGDSIRQEEAAIARAMYDKIKDQQRTIDQQSHRMDLLSNQISDGEELMKTYRHRTSELQNEIENLRLEVEARPPLKAWNAKVKEVEELEGKLHDVIMMRKESAELEGWKKHVGTRERIKADRRNHELGLWILESLPKAVMKDVVEAACRELDINDISEIVPCIAKLKAVVKAVPRMERFIANVCNYVFQRADNTLSLPAKPTMEDIIPVLKKWWEGQKIGSEYQKFYKQIANELGRRETLLSDSGDIPPAPIGSSHPPQWTSNSGAQWSGLTKGPDAAVALVREVIDFQMEVLRHKTSFRAAEEFIREHPEAMANRIISHVQYLFDIKQLEGFLPRMNQVYLFYNEMRNFLQASKTQMNLSKTEGDSATLAQLQRVISKVYGQ